MKVRIQFTKHGSMKFIGHLDTMRFFQKAIRRSGIDIAYTGGYSPHQIMTFAQPLGVGTESESEIVDIEINSFDLPDGSHDLQRALDDQMCEGFTIRDVRLLPDDAPNAMSSVSGASYEVLFRQIPDHYGDSIAEQYGFDPAYVIGSIMSSDSVIVRKKTKKSELEVDIRPGLYELSSDGQKIFMKVDASSAGNIKPETVIREIFARAEMEYPEGNIISILRTEVYGRDDSGNLKPLIEFGSVIK